MAAAAVILSPNDDTDQLLVGPRHTLAASLREVEWRRWEEHLMHWPPPIRERLVAARH